MREEPVGTQLQCQNCGAHLAGPYCHHCGQEARPAVLFFGTLALEFLRETISLDSRVMRTLLALLGRPGLLTNAYLRGQRKRYVPPLRLFLFTSLVCIFAIWLLNVTGERELIVGPGELATENGELAPEQRQQILERISGVELEQLEPAERAELEARLARLENALEGGDPDPSVAEAGNADPAAPGIVNVTYTEEGLSLELPGVSEEDTRKLEARLEKSVDKIRSDPNDFANDVLENVPQATLLLVPLFALLMKLAYLFSGRYYVEHLIHALYGHAFLFLAVLLMVGLDIGDTRVSASASSSLQWLGHLLGLLEVLLSFWVPAYFLLSLRVVYGQSWGMTL
ncbi:MAG: DUF3667 domain-containing protein, partial [Haliea sp.]|uniref:DUF3667 domain-containing protein n=1 Tax=Haliea sp. TaxID=1932666 RepID=UPI0032EC935A